MNCLVEMLPRISRDVWTILTDMPEGELDIHHLGLGLYLREHVLTPDNALYKLFMREGVTQKDDMSAQMIRRWHQALQTQTDESGSGYIAMEQPQSDLWRVNKMKLTGIIRKIDELGRIVLPAEVCKLFDLKEKDELEVLTDEGGIYLKPYDTMHCVFCAGKDNLIPHGDRYICGTCLTKINERVAEK